MIWWISCAFPRFFFSLFQYYPIHFVSYSSAREVGGTRRIRSIKMNAVEISGRWEWMWNVGHCWEHFELGLNAIILDTLECTFFFKAHLLRSNGKRKLIWIISIIGPFVVAFKVVSSVTLKYSGWERKRSWSLHRVVSIGFLHWLKIGWIMAVLLLLVSPLMARFHIWRRYSLNQRTPRRKSNGKLKRKNKMNK